jgi:hypothetical protein
MASIPLTLAPDYWKSLQVTRQDIEFIHNRLFEIETPLTVQELAEVVVEERLRQEQEALLQQQRSGGKVYLPQENYKSGEALVFPALNWARGKVTGVRPGMNPELGEFEVIEVALEDGDRRSFAAALEAHTLNQPDEEPGEQDQITPAAVLAMDGAGIERKLEAALGQDKDLVRIAGRWFPRALLVDVNLGHLNLAEAVLDMAGEEPQPTSALLKDAGLPEGINPKLAEFSLNYALQEDERFDEVGPAGQVLWCLRRLEPLEVRQIPPYLHYSLIEHDRETLTADMLALEAELDDELSELDPAESGETEVLITLTYPHWRAGTLPVSPRLRSFFPTAYESPRIRFTLVDGRSGERMPGWVVRESQYVSGLQQWYQEQDLFPGSLVSVGRGEQPGEVVIQARSKRQTREWVRTVLIGADGGLVFALLKQMIACEYNERMVIAVPDVGAVDALWEKTGKSRQSFEKLVAGIMRELTKLNPQGHVHAQELYAAVNIMRRCPPAPLFHLLASSPAFVHVGDLHFRLDEPSPEEG